MAQYKDVVVNAGPSGFGGPLVLKPTDKRNKVVVVIGAENQGNGRENC